jgi:HSP20 family protein
MFNTMFNTDVRRTLDDFRRSVDQLFDNLGSAPARSGEQQGRSEWTFSPVLESAWTDHALHVRAIVPGVADKDLSVNVQGNQLILEGERRRPEQFGNNAWTQLAYGKFYTAVTLPNGLNLEKVACRLHEGVLDIEIPVAEAMRPRQIQIETGEGRKAINA